jgi:hypothetical protein
MTDHSEILSQWSPIDFVDFNLTRFQTRDPKLPKYCGVSSGITSKMQGYWILVVKLTNWLNSTLGCRSVVKMYFGWLDN